MSAVRLLLLSTLLCDLAICNSNIGCFERCKCLNTFIDCSANSYQDFPKQLPDWVDNLDLSLNKFDGVLKINVVNCSYLTKLKLSKNFLTSIPTFTGKTKIDHLNLAQNKIDKLGSFAFKNLHHLKFLDLSKNKLEFLKDNTFPKSSHLRVLNLNNNLISNLSNNCFDTLLQLQELKISNNALQNLPNGLFKNLSNLELLDFTKNQITVIEGLLFKDLSNLKTLILRHNKIKDLQDGLFYGLSSLQFMYLDGNNLNRTSKGWFYGLASLNYLNLSHNKIEKIVSGWEYCPSLEELDLSHNKLKCVEKINLEHLKKLQKLNLNNNQLYYIEDGSFNNLPLIKVLKMDNNNLAWIMQDAKEPFNGLNNLKILSLANNNILYIKEEAFKGLYYLDELNLLQNDILEIENKVFGNMPNLFKLYLNTTSLQCDCSMVWIQQPYVYEQLPFDFVNIVCGFPEKNKGKRLDELSVVDFSCDENSPKPMIVFHPESKMVLEGENITLKCGVNSSSTDKINFVWKKDNHDLELISTYNLSSEFNGRTQYSILNLYNISMMQNGKYQCVASNKFGISYSNSSILSVVIFPYFVKVPRNSSINTGVTAILECAANGYPIPQISWQKDGGNDFPAAQERRMKVMSKDDEFLIVDVKLADMGVYSCTARNIAGVIAVNATLNVLEPPWFGNIMVNKHIKMGQEVVLECIGFGFPKPKITWTKDNSLINTSNKHYFTGKDQLLVIMNTSINDSGTYQCELSNTAGSKLQQVDVEIMPLFKSLIHDYTLGFIITFVIICIVITCVLWAIFAYKARYPSSALIDNIDIKSINSTNSKDSGTGESTKRSQEQLYNECLNPCQQLNENIEDLSPEIHFPLLSEATVVLSKNSVVYKHSKIIESPDELSIEKLPESTKECNDMICDNNSA